MDIAYLIIATAGGILLGYLLNRFLLKRSARKKHKKEQGFNTNATSSAPILYLVMLLSFSFKRNKF